MAILTWGNQLRAAFIAPAVALAFAAIVYIVVWIGCTPPFSHAYFFDVPVTVFLLFALTVAALILIVFAGWNAWRAYRVLRRRHGGADFPSRQTLGAAGIGLVLVAFAATAWLGLYFLATPCP